MHYRIFIILSFGASLFVHAQDADFPNLAEVLPPVDADPKIDGGLGDVLSDFSFEDFVAPTLPKNISITNTGGIRYDRASNTIFYSGSIVATGNNGVQIKSSGARYDATKKTLLLERNVVLDDPKGARIIANKATFDSAANAIYLTGNVHAYQGPAVYQGDAITYNIDKRVFESGDLQASLFPFIVDASDFRKTTSNKGREIFVGENVAITTDDSENPQFWMRAEKATIYPNEKVSLKDVSFDVSDHTILRLPSFTQYFDPRLGYFFQPGVRTNLGPFLKNRYGILHGSESDDGEANEPWLISQWNFDIYSARGTGIGVDLIDKRLDENPNLEGLTFYYINDIAPNTRRASIPRNNVNEDRYKIGLKHRYDTGQLWEMNSYVDANLNFISDAFYLEDYDRDLARIDSEPDNTIAFTASGEHSLLTALGRVRINDFYRSDTRLPEITFEQTRHQIFDLPFYYENQTQIGKYDEIYPEEIVNPLLTERATLGPSPRRDRIDDLLADRGFNRFHTYHSLSSQLNYGGWLNILPRAGLGYTHYSDIVNGIDDEGRALATVGVDTSVTWSKALPDIKSEFWGLDGLVHVFQPYNSISLVKADDLDPLFRGIDRFPPSTRPQQLELGRFTAIDSIRDWSIFRIGARNQLLTRRGDDEAVQWLSLDTYIDVFDKDPEFDRDLSNLYNEVTWNPAPWSQYFLRTQFPLKSNAANFEEIASGADLQINENTKLVVAHRYLNDHPVLEDANIISCYIYHSINDEWGWSARQDWRLEDSRLELQQYSIHRDWGSWVGSAGLSQRNNDGENELGLIFTLTLKDIPSITLPFSLDAQ